MADPTTRDTQNLGYDFHPCADPGMSDSMQLDIVLRATPTRLHFDPEWVSLDVKSTTGGVESLTINHPWRRPTTHYSACAGRVIWGDRKDETCVAFTFGGDFEIKPEDEQTTCVLISPTPIIHVTHGFAAPTMLAFESEVLLAKRRAKWLDDLASFEKRLAVAEPLVLYRACLESLQEAFESLPAEAQDETTQEFMLFLETEHQKLQACWDQALQACKLSELL